MEIFIARDAIQSNSLTFSEDFLGKYPRQNQVDYTIRADLNDFITRFRIIYDDRISVLQLDDKITGKFDPPYAGANHYPGFDEFLKLNEASAMEMIYDFFKGDILRLYLKEGDVGGHVGWVVNSLDSFRITGSKMEIDGKAVPWDLRLAG